ncbi:hypothetical protein I4F81_003898 [Pyropia yezoensis]|uniref:Uncharacterized protein n=1 Tax=Pyropia yezoensis TaxID=2788 RepID=A0ACC3BTM5_PYRYE|nr:hypothetical protein I4F81_003898 [Neopyropia yezoensis]
MEDHGPPPALLDADAGPPSALLDADADVHASRNGDDDDLPVTCCHWGGHTATEIGTSWLLRPLVLLAWRVGLAAWVVGTLSWLAASDRLDMVFFTNVNYSVLSGALFWLACATTFSVLVAKRPHRHVLWTITVLGVQVVATNALFLDVVYWALLYDTLTFAGLVVHAINAVAVLADVALSSYHLRWVYLIPSAAAALLWVFGFAWPYYAASGTWVYNFLDYRTHSAGYMVGIYLGMTAWHLVAGALVVGLCRLRDWAVSRRRRRQEGGVISAA